ncbi:hypothetical protein NMYAN_10142 [Nitrosomonas nitrosa]|uniref:eCIS core domain-containing protein n=1 Tax=Nitrosomonas nitrosa TaxID=52442 RepID=A0A8H9D7X3_9PROT|nr:DUF4157 domain-containing protein [Nitrosomonas nitrosa]CAE6484110.1 hypothetical protein NMYAN_10142 [Nitrosomonas nitrosa]
MNKTDKTQLANKTSFSPLSHGMLQRKCACGSHVAAGKECAACAKQKQTLQRKAINRDDMTPVSSIVHGVLNSAGQPLDPTAKTFMESRFGRDFSKVRIHTDANAAESARMVNAFAYTVGRDVVFGAGQYSPHTRMGQRLLAHELAHTLQQDKNIALTTNVLKVNEPNDRYEQEADHIADQVLTASVHSMQSEERQSVPTIPSQLQESPPQIARLVATTGREPEGINPLESEAIPMAAGPECSRQRGRGRSLPLARTTFRGERGFASIPSDGHPGPGGLLVTGSSVSIKIIARWEEQITDPDQRPPDQRNRRADRPQYYLTFNGWVDDCDSSHVGSPASSVQSGNLAIGTEHTVNLANLIPGRYGLGINPSTASPEPNRVLVGTCEVT